MVGQGLLGTLRRLFLPIKVCSRPQTSAQVAVGPQAEKARATHRRHGTTTPAGAGISAITKRRMGWPRGGRQRARWG